MKVMDHHPLLAEWREEAARYERRGLHDLAALVRSMADDLERFDREHALEELTLAEAAEESGYSVAHIARLVHDGDLPNAGRKHRPRIHRGDLKRPIRRKSKASPQEITAASPLVKELIADGDLEIAR